MLDAARAWMLQAEASAWTVSCLSGLTVGIILGTQRGIRVEALGAIGVIILVAVAACIFLLRRTQLR
ncbi:MAG TPA: hypothetical protein VIU61_02585 [Kofleriaceae bacterium]